MLLQRLKQYADERMDMPPTLYSETPVRYIIELDSRGQPLSPVPTDTADPTSRSAKRGTPRKVPQVTRSVAITPLLLADKADYTLGIGGENAKPERVQACRNAYRELVERCAATTGEPEVQAVAAFLAGDPAARLELPADFDPGALITFSVDGVFPTDLPAVRAFWAAEHDPAARNATVMQCIVCGQERPVLDRLQGKIKGVPGGQTSGTAIISANAQAFESYGLEASLVAPTCADCGERFTKALNGLLADRSSHFTVGNAAFVFWTRRPVATDILAPLNQPNPEQVRALIDSVRSGRVPELDDTAFYATLLSGSGGRAVVRDWIDTTVGEVKASLARWFLGQQIVDEYGAPAPPLSIYRLAVATVYESKDLPAATPRALLRAALAGAPLPAGLLYQAVRRNRAEQNVSRPRAALIKLVLQRAAPAEQEDTMAQLDLQNPDPAYRYGRLLAVLAEIQRTAIGKAAIVDRFYGTASSAPASVFARLLRGARPHLAKLERDKRWLYLILEPRLEEILSGIDGFQNTLTLEQQGMFALGFYHQRAHDRAQMKSDTEQRRTTDDTADLSDAE
ncbi:MAG TPA: type I-C CRISPR-associated protein Cas8c/Csd1 [Roseiflexaceae bacterium]|nr:type I-C CRISPR-associated protein Cas8c/Csd1 [Roseiflexaceae bacterium]